MRTTFDIDSALLDSVVSATGEKSKSRAVNAALKEYIRRKHVQELIDSWGTIIVDDYSEQALAVEERKAASQSHEKQNGGTLNANHTGRRPRPAGRRGRDYR